MSNDVEQYGKTGFENNQVTVDEIGDTLQEVKDYFNFEVKKMDLGLKKSHVTSANNVGISLQTAIILFDYLYGNKEASFVPTDFAVAFNRVASDFANAQARVEKALSEIVNLKKEDEKLSEYVWENKKPLPEGYNKYSEIEKAWKGKNTEIESQQDYIREHVKDCLAKYAKEMAELVLNESNKKGNIYKVLGYS